MAWRVGKIETVAGLVLVLALALPTCTIYFGVVAARRLETSYPGLNYSQRVVSLNADVQLKAWQAARALHQYQADRDAAAEAGMQGGIDAARSDVAQMRSLLGGPNAGQAFANLAPAVERFAAQLDRERAAAAGATASARNEAAAGDWQLVRPVEEAAAQVDAEQRQETAERRRAATAFSRTWNRWIYASLAAGVLLMIACVLALLGEIRKRRRAERELQRRHMLELAEAEHLASIGEIAAGLAHEIRNPLGGISAVFDILGSEVGPHEDREAVTEARKQVGRIQSVVEELLHYARPRPLELAPGNLNATIEEAIPFVSRQAHSRGIEVTFESAELPPVTHDPERIHQVVINLGLNALHAVPDGGRIRIATWFDSAYGLAGFDVQDNGTGIAASDLGQVFRPFYSTKGSGGTGLGLSLCRRIAELHGGTISVKSSEGEGSTFTVAIPTGRRVPRARTAVDGG